MTTALINIEHARKLLAQARTLHDVKDVRDKAEAMRVFMKTRVGSLEAQQHAAELKLRAERRLGEMLAENVVVGGNRRSKSNDATLKTIPDGITRDNSSRWQRIATLPEPVFEQELATIKEAGDEITTNHFLKLKKMLDKKEKQAEAQSTDDAVECDSLEKLIADGKTFGTIYADPPWRYGNQATRASTDNHYGTMSVADICAMPIAKLAAKKAHLHLWTTNAFLRDSFAVLESWGFEYKSIFVWVKPQMGIGNYWRVSHELMLLGVRGGLTFSDHSQMSWLHKDRERHSGKPEAVRRLIEKVSPGPRLELFGRKLVDGWTVFGNQIERNMFDGKDSNKEAL